MAKGLEEKPIAKKNGLVRVLFLIYLLVLVWAVLWKLGIPHIGDGPLRTINLTPFYGTQTGDFNSIPEMLFNILIFIPFGLYVSVLAPKRVFIKRVLLALLCSAIFEVLQYILAIGRSDVTDLILNTFGGIAGIAVFSVLSRLFGRDARRVVLVVCVAITILELALAVAVPVLFRRLV